MTQVLHTPPSVTEGATKCLYTPNRSDKEP
jgi:hypothetical protein